MKSATFEFSTAGLAGFAVKSLVILGAASLSATASDAPPASGKGIESQPALEAVSPVPDPNPEAGQGVRVVVLDAEDGRGLSEFRVLAGIPAPGIAGEYEKRTGQTAVNWQPHTLRLGTNGEFIWSAERGYPLMVIRVEADGYQPQVSALVKKEDGAQRLTFRLAPDPGVAGRVLTPDGKAAAGATVALALPQKDAVLQGEELRGMNDPAPDRPGDQWRRPLLVKTDAEGRFTLPTETGPAAVLVLHASGVRELSYADFRAEPELTLERWGQIDGRILWGDQPGVREEITLTIHRDEFGYPGMIAQYVSAESDDEGRFTFRKILPGLTQIARPIKTAEPSPSGFAAITLDGLGLHVTVQPGEPTPVLLGGKGRTVKGKLSGLNSYEDVHYHFHPNAPHIGFPGDDEIWKAFGQFRESAIGPLFFRDKQPVGEDGSFEIRDMLPGHYQLFVSAPGFPGYAASIQVRVEPETPGEQPAGMNLGVIPITAPAKRAGVENEACGPEESADETGEPVPVEDVAIRGKAVDAETGEPIGALIIQAGKFDPANPDGVTWGYSESRSSARDGSFTTSVRWAEGWTARVLADGYVPEPVLTEAPPAGLKEIEVTLRLKRGRRVRGQVLDHRGDPVSGAAVYAVGPTRLNLAAGRAWTTWGEPNEEAKPVTADEDGRFELPAGAATHLAVSHVGLDAWPAPIPAEGDMSIRLPEPARVDVQLNIDGAEEESVVFYQLLSHLSQEFQGLDSTRELPIANGGTVSLPALPPGRYQICRRVMHRLGDVGMGGMLDRQFFELSPGETRMIRWVRETGARIRGRITWPEDVKLSGVIVSVNAVEAEKSPFEDSVWHTTYASLVAGVDGSFLTERILPGRYVLSAEGYLPLTPEQRRRTGMVGPAFRAELNIEVPATGPAEMTLEPVRLETVQR